MEEGIGRIGSSHVLAALAIKPKSTIPTLGKCSGPQGVEWEGECCGSVPDTQGRVVGKAFTFTGKNSEGQNSFRCVTYSIGGGNNPIHLASHLALHKTKHNRASPPMAKTADAQPTTGLKNSLKQASKSKPTNQIRG